VALNIVFSPRALADVERILTHLLSHEVADAGSRVAEIVAAVDILAQHPRIGRPAGQGLRELVIGQDARGYVALYQHLPARNEVRVLAMRAQREAGYRG
jgi:plasmid stabilization system protein ParE